MENDSNFPSMKGLEIQSNLNKMLDDFDKDRKPHISDHNRFQNRIQKVKNKLDTYQFMEGDKETNFSKQSDSSLKGFKRENPKLRNEDNQSEDLVNIRNSSRSNSRNKDIKIEEEFNSNFNIQSYKEMEKTEVKQASVSPNRLKISEKFRPFGKDQSDIKTASLFEDSSSKHEKEILQKNKSLNPKENNQNNFFNSRNSLSKNDAIQENQNNNNEVISKNSNIELKLSREIQEKPKDYKSYFSPKVEPRPIASSNIPKMESRKVDSEEKDDFLELLNKQIKPSENIEYQPKIRTFEKPINEIEIESKSKRAEKPSFYKSKVEEKSEISRSNLSKLPEKRLSKENSFFSIAKIDVNSFSPPQNEEFVRGQRLYQRGLEEEFSSDSPNIHKALKYYKDAAELNYPEALYTLFTYYEEGRIVSKNSEIAKEYLEKAAGLGYSLALKRILNFRRCLHCDSEEATSIFNPCSHKICCRNCAEMVRMRYGDCSKCRVKIKSIMHTKNFK